MFEIRVDGETVYTCEGQVVGVAIDSARGELYNFGVHNEGVINLRLSQVRAGDPIRLDQLEAAQRRFQASLVEGHQSGQPARTADSSMALRQEIGDNTLTESGDDRPGRDGFNRPPSVDLAQGLNKDDPNFSDIVSARVEAFNSHGDAQRAVDEVTLDSFSSSGATQTDQGAGQSLDQETNPFDIGGPDNNMGVPEAPPKSGTGSGRDRWVAYAELVGVEVTSDMDRDAIIQAVESQQTESQQTEPTERTNV